MDLEQIKKRVIIAMFADDELMHQFVLKGGNWLDVVHGISTRPSKDIDLSIASEFDDVEDVRRRLERSLLSTFAEHRYVVFDVHLRQEPPDVSSQ
jgi:hypothetical protein